jgi:hypothetical protein
MWVWDSDSLRTLLIYANYLKNVVYNESDNIKVISKGDGEDDDQEYGDDNDDA